VAMISALVLFTNILSTFGYQYQIDFHYSLIAVPALAIGTVYAVGVMRDHTLMIPGAMIRGRRLLVPTRHVAMVVLATASITAAYLWAPMPLGRTPSWYGNPEGTFAQSARELFDEIPADAVVSAQYQLTPHLAHREQIYQFPVPFRVVLYGPDSSMEGRRLDDRAEQVDVVMLPVARDDRLVADWTAIEAAFTEIGRNEAWVLYERDRSIPLPRPR
jgi:uncharacterized membrane protein